MQRKHNALTSFLRVGTFAAIVMAAATVMAADVTGNWTWTAPARGGGRNGGGGAPGGGAAPAPAAITAKLKAEGTKLTGSVAMPARGGGDPQNLDITNGKIDGDKISFDIVRDFNGNSITNSYEGVLSGDTIKGTQPAQGGRGRRGGGGPGGAPADTSNPPPAPVRPEWTATRVK